MLHSIGLNFKPTLPAQLTLPRPFIQFLTGPVFSQIAPFPGRKLGQPGSLIGASQHAPCAISDIDYSNQRSTIFPTRRRRSAVGRVNISRRPWTTCDPDEAPEFRAEANGHDVTYREMSRAR
jgi:hypothetical protein